MRTCYNPFFGAPSREIGTPHNLEKVWACPDLKRGFTVQSFLNSQRGSFDPLPVHRTHTSNTVCLTGDATINSHIWQTLTLRSIWFLWPPILTLTSLGNPFAAYLREFGWSWVFVGRIFATENNGIRNSNWIHKRTWYPIPIPLNS